MKACIDHWVVPQTGSGCQKASRDLLKHCWCLFIRFADDNKNIKCCQPYPLSSVDVDTWQLRERRFISVCGFLDVFFSAAVELLKTQRCVTDEYP